MSRKQHGYIADCSWCNKSNPQRRLVSPQAIPQLARETQQDPQTDRVAVTSNVLEKPRFLGLRDVGVPKVQRYQEPESPMESPAHGAVLDADLLVDVEAMSLCRPRPKSFCGSREAWTNDLIRDTFILDDTCLFFARETYFQNAPIYAAIINRPPLQHLSTAEIETLIESAKAVRDEHPSDRKSRFEVELGRM